MFISWHSCELSLIATAILNLAKKSLSEAKIGTISEHASDISLRMYRIAR